MKALDFLNSFLNYEQVTAYRYPEAFSLDRMERLLERLGNPHRRYRTLHVAGTKGKGSICAFAASILQATGLRVGLYTSPHLSSFRERIQVDRRPISEEGLEAAVEAVRPFVVPDLTFFEVTTACAFVAFARKNLDLAVVEVGMGGRLDATNTLSPEVTSVTPISLDHMDKLGSTVEAIAREKAGILKPGVPAVIAPQSPEAMRVLQETAYAQGVPFHSVEQEVGIEGARLSLEGTCVCLRTPVREYRDLAIPLIGSHQISNAAVALRMVELFSVKKGQALFDEGAVREGIARTRWPGRCQWIPGNPPILLDGAQNAASAAALRETVETLLPGRPVTLLFGASTGKDLEGMARILGPWASRLILAKADVPRAESPERLASAFHSWHPDPLRVESVSEALERARQITGPAGLVVVTGSLFVVGEALNGASVSSETESPQPLHSRAGSPR